MCLHGRGGNANGNANANGNVNAQKIHAGLTGKCCSLRVKQVHAINRKGEQVILSHEDMGYSYRNSEAGSDLIFTSAVFEGVVEDKQAIQAAMDEVQHHRETVQPIKEKTGGSTFKNPDGYSAWKLIDEAGLRGFKVGGASMSEMHCNFMINNGNASAYDLEKLGEIVREKVLANSKIRLDWEIKRIGRFAGGQKHPCVI